MRILITGADQPLGGLVAAALRDRHELRLTGAQALALAGLEALPYLPADLREPDQVIPLVDGMEAVAHLALHAPLVTPDVAAEGQALDVSARGIFVLLHEALKSGVRRVVLASRLDSAMGAYPENYVVDETWKPMPDATAASLAPYLAEITLREFVRAEEIVGVCLRMGDLGSGPADTTPEDAVAAIEKALTMDLKDRKYRWWLYHICSGDRYSPGAASHGPLHFTRGGA
jgi:nucleoside-diphosphate-sugar epimerase